MGLFHSFRLVVRVVVCIENTVTLRNFRENNDKVVKLIDGGGGGGRRILLRVVKVIFAFIVRNYVHFDWLAFCILSKLTIRSVYVSSYCILLLLNITGFSI